MEIADIVVVNKSDGDNIARSKTAKADIQKALHLFPPLESGWIPQALLCSSLERTGLTETWEVVTKYQEKVIATGYFNELRVNQSSWWLKESIQEMLLDDFNNHPKVSTNLKSLEVKVKEGEVSVSEASEQLIRLYLGKNPNQG
jgi:LAO/AO transport system kinase